MIFLWFLVVSCFGNAYDFVFVFVAVCFILLYALCILCLLPCLTRSSFIDDLSLMIFHWWSFIDDLSLMIFHWWSFMYPHWGFWNKPLDLTWLDYPLAVVSLVQLRFGSPFSLIIIIMLIIIITMYIYHALINTLSAYMIHINLNMIFYTHVEHSPTKTIYIKYY